MNALKNEKNIVNTLLFSVRLQIIKICTLYIQNTMWYKQTTRFIVYI